MEERRGRSETERRRERSETEGRRGIEMCYGGVKINITILGKIFMCGVH